MLFHGGCSSGRQNKFPGLLVTKQELFRQHQFLGTVPEELQRSSAQVLSEHFWHYSWPEEEEGGGMQHHPHRILGQNLQSDGRVQYLVMKCTCSSFCHHTDGNNFHINWAPLHVHLLWAATPLRDRDTKGGKDSSSGTGSTSRSARKTREQLPNTWNSWDALLPKILAEEKETGTDTHNNYFLLHYNK